VAGPAHDARERRAERAPADHPYSGHE